MRNKYKGLIFDISITNKPLLCYYYHNSQPQALVFTLVISSAYMSRGAERPTTSKAHIKISNNTKTNGYIHFNRIIIYVHNLDYWFNGNCKRQVTMSVRITLDKKRLYEIFQEGAHFAAHGGGNFDDMDKAFDKALEKVCAEDVAEQMDKYRKESEELYLQNQITVNPQLADKLKKLFINEKDD